MLTIVGLGPGDPAALPPRSLALLTSGGPVLLRTARHPVFQAEPLAALLGAGKLTPLDDEYEAGASFTAVYDAIVARVLRTAEGAATHGSGLVYAVPGHPLVGESTVARLLLLTQERGIDVRVFGAPSFVDACLEAIGFAVTGNVHVVDTLSLAPDAPTPPAAIRTGGDPVLLYQVHSREAASNAKLALMRVGYPDEFEVIFIQSAGIPGRERLILVPLYALDRSKAPISDLPLAWDHLTSVWVPPIDPAALKPSFPNLVAVMARLRDPNGGCPWDLKQTHATLRPYVIEEAYEVVEAIDADDPDKLCDELGDLLLQVVFHAQLASEEGVFDTDDVCAAIVEKLLRRHPHVFGDISVSGADEVLTNWNAIKATEKAHEDRKSILDGIPKSLPALLRSLEISKRAVKSGFEWPDTRGVLDKAEEEFAELRAEIEAGSATDARVADELGDLLFTMVNVARRLGVDPEEALRGQNARFMGRFRHIESSAAEQGRDVSALSLAEMEALWQEAKGREG
jgi:tetrapyrrole methylase family protein/MazG family protein